MVNKGSGTARPVLMQVGVVFCLLPYQMKKNWSNDFRFSTLSLPNQAYSPLQKLSHQHDKQELAERIKQVVALSESGKA
jgi:hypothetical protein